MSTIAATNSLLRSTRNWMAFLMRSGADASRETSGGTRARFQQFCSAHEKGGPDRAFSAPDGAREQFCRAEAAVSATGPALRPARWSEPETWSSTT